MAAPPPLPAPAAPPPVAAAPPEPAPPGPVASLPAAQPPPPSHAAPAFALPEFPWPPPAASTRFDLARDLFKRRETVGEVANQIVAALENSGYVERSFFRTTADGVVLVTRIERINIDGTPSALRWPAWRGNQSGLNLQEFLSGLFYVDRGRYRVIVFVLQERLISPSPRSATAAEARVWLQTGANRLPREVANRPYGDSVCSVLVYEFASDGRTVRTVDSSITAQEHLEKAGLTASLQRRN